MTDEQAAMFLEQNKLMAAALRSIANSLEKMANPIIKVDAPANRDPVIKFKTKFVDLDGAARKTLAELAQQ